MAGVILLIAIYYLIYNAIPSEGYSSYLEDKAILDSIVKQMEVREGLQPERHIVHFHFNPNAVSVDSLKLLGLPERLARTINNYRTKGGKFKSKEDIKKIHGFPDSIYQRLKPFIVIPATYSSAKKEATPEKERFPKKQEYKNKQTLAAFDLNKADSLQLLQWKGIGPVLASRIVRFRNKLGGFVEKEQLYEVYGLDSILAKKLLALAFIDADFQPERIRINEASVEELATHPYISHAQARRLLEYKNQHGPFRSLSDLLNIHTLGPNFAKKIAPYIRFD